MAMTPYRLKYENPNRYGINSFSTNVNSVGDTVRICYPLVRSGRLETKRDHPLNL